MTKSKEGLALGTRNEKYYITGYYFCEQHLHDWVLFLFSVDFRLRFGVRLGRCSEGLGAFRVFFQNMSMYSTGGYSNVVVFDSHFRRVVLATDKTTVIQRVSHRPTNK